MNPEQRSLKADDKMPHSPIESDGEMEMENGVNHSLEGRKIRKVDPEKESPKNEKDVQAGKMEKENKRTLGFGRLQPENGNHFTSNFIKTGKYTWWNFLPISLLYQFKRYANVYFLIQAIMQSIPAISPWSPLSAIAPLVIVISLSMAREAFEEIQKYLSDVKLNSSEATKWDGSGWVKIKWKDIVVGDILKVEKHDFFPADLAVLKSSNEEGACFIETSSLDGEKTLKPKMALKELNEALKEDSICIHGRVTESAPNPDLYQYNGLISYSLRENDENFLDLPMNEKQLMLRGAVLKNTDWVIGLVAYSGKDTKVIKNSEKSKFKQSRTEAIANRLILFLLSCQIIMALFSFIYCWIWYTINIDGLDPIYSFDDGPGLLGFLLFFTVELLLSGMIPISLVVSIEFVKLLEGIMMANDADMHLKNNERDIKCKVSNYSLMEELGQVHYIFSDKTGTLTCNRMEFRMCVIGKELYGDDTLLRQSPEFVQLQIKEKELADSDLHEVMRRNSGIKEDEEKSEGKFRSNIHSQLRLIKRKPTFEDPREGVVYSFRDDRLMELLFKKNEQEDDGDNIKIDFRDINDQKILYTISSEKILAHEFMLCLSLCHSCVVEVDKETKEVTNYQGMSPDEISLVDSARHLGYMYKGGNSNQLFLDINGKNLTFDCLQAFEFNSDRKRMSVLVRDQGIIKFYVKGADMTILPRLKEGGPKNQPYEQFIKTRLTEFSKIGLRTLCVAMRIVENSEWEQINKEILKCQASQDKEKLLLELAEIIEKDFTLIGCTAVEDKLQDGVPETIADFQKAGISVWMCTGDKLETGESIASSCKLVQPDYKLWRLESGCDINRMAEIIETEMEECKRLNIKRSVAIEGSQVALIIQNKELQVRFLNILTDCNSVVACRLTPKQKADMVRLVKNHLGLITMAVGDGSNDVSMIQEAHIGIGIYGNEGMRAVQCSDYAVAEFQYIWRLLFVHGRWSYMRVSEMILYFFYKNMVVSIPQFFFLFSNAWSGQSLFDDYYVTCYNLFFTSLPLVIRALLDQDVNYKVWTKNKLNGKQQIEYLQTLRHNFPYLYYIGQDNLIFTIRQMFFWIFQGAVHAILIYVTCYFVFNDNHMNSEGNSPDFWTFSITLYTTIIFVNFHNLTHGFWRKMLFCLVF